MFPFKASLNASTLFPFKLDVKQQLQIAAAAGYDGIELWVRDIEAYLKNGGTISELKSYAAETGLTIVTANPHMYRKMPFNPDVELAAVTNVASGPQAVVVHAGFPAKTLQELISMAKAKPKSINFGSAGIGTQTHLAAENFVSAAGIDVTHVPYKGEGPALTDLVGGQIQFVTPNLSAAIGFVQQGKLRALAVTSKERSKQLPNVPSVAETLPGFENLGWFGFMVPRGTSSSVIASIHRDTAKVLQLPEVRGRFEQLGMEPVGNTPGEFARAIKEESVRWAKIIAARKLYVD
jgi:tripartite-type tricarboxylate transporter receptor subunit TctC